MSTRTTLGLEVQGQEVDSEQVAVEELRRGRQVQVEVDFALGDDYHGSER